jgi:ABC-type glycerol-3-phosphate transport system substrate-binding protein
VEFLKFLTRPEAQREMAGKGFFIPVAKGADRDMVNPFFKINATNLAASPYHQIFYDQMLGPSVGRVVKRRVHRHRRRQDGTEGRGQRDRGRAQELSLDA